MPKFRTMRVDAPQLPTHLLTDSVMDYSDRKTASQTSLDELPQLWSILKGRMSFVGPRPAHFNQHDLIQLRANCGVDEMAPGLTGWAQINGRDELSIPRKAELDKYYLDHQSLALDIKIILLTIENVS